MIFKLFVIVGVFLSTFAYAGVCEITITRNPCPGKEKIALQTYAGKGLEDVPPYCTKCNPTVELKPATNAAECAKKAQDVVRILRKGVIAKKSVSAKFAGDPVSLSVSSDESKCK